MRPIAAVEPDRDDARKRPFVHIAGQYPSLRARRAVQYSKGALFLAHLREEIGDTAFWNGLRGFTQRHAGGTVTSSDFQNAMQQASRRDLFPMFAEWVYGESSAAVANGS